MIGQGQGKGADYSTHVVADYGQLPIFRQLDLAVRIDAAKESELVAFDAGATHCTPLEGLHIVAPKGYVQRLHLDHVGRARHIQDGQQRVYIDLGSALVQPMADRQRLGQFGDATEFRHFAVLC